MTTVLKQRQSTGDRGGLLTGPPRPAHPPHARTDLQALPLCGLTVAFGLHVAEGGGLKGLWKAPEQARRPPLPAEVRTPCWEAC